MTVEAPKPKRRGCPPGGWPKKAGAKKRKATRKAKTATPSFNIDDKGALAIIHSDGTGVELSTADSLRLHEFLTRVIPRQVFIAGPLSLEGPNS